jgi:tight adherence protein B
VNLMLAAAFLAAAGGVVAVVLRPTTIPLARRMAPYANRIDGSALACDVPDALRGMLRPPAEAVEHLAADLLARHEQLGRLTRMVQRANIPFAPAEVLGASLVLGVAAALVAGAAGAPVPLVALSVLLGGVAPIAGVGAAARRRQRRFAEGLPGMLRLLASTTRAGFPLSQAVAGAAADLGGPVAEELRRVAAETSLGRTLPDALGRLGERMGDDDITWVALALEVQQQTGGNLAELLDQVARTIALRQQLAREVRTLTAEGRLSAIVLGILPPALAIAIAVLNPGYVEVLVSTSEGRAMSVSAALAMGVGFVWMSRIVRVEP